MGHFDVHHKVSSEHIVLNKGTNLKLSRSRLRAPSRAKDTRRGYNVIGVSVIVDLICLFHLALVNNITRERLLGASRFIGNIS